MNFPVFVFRPHLLRVARPIPGFRRAVLLRPWPVFFPKSPTSETWFFKKNLAASPGLFHRPDCSWSPVIPATRTDAYFLSRPSLIIANILWRPLRRPDDLPIKKVCLSIAWSRACANPLPYSSSPRKGAAAYHPIGLLFNVLRLHRSKELNREHGLLRRPLGLGAVAGPPASINRRATLPAHARRATSMVPAAVHPSRVTLGDPLTTNIAVPPRRLLRWPVHRVPGTPPILAALLLFTDIAYSFFVFVLRRIPVHRPGLGDVSRFYMFRCPPTSRRFSEPARRETDVSAESRRYYFAPPNPVHRADVQSSLVLTMLPSLSEEETHGERRKVL